MLLLILQDIYIYTHTHHVQHSYVYLYIVLSGYLANLIAFTLFIYLDLYYVTISFLLHFIIYLHYCNSLYKLNQSQS